MSTVTQNTHLDKLQHIMDLSDDYDVFLFDVWGVIYEDNGPYIAASKTVNKLIEQGKHVIFVSNAPRPQQNAIDKISSECGITIKPQHFFTSGHIALQMLDDPAQYFGIKNPQIYNIGRDRNQVILANHPHLEVFEPSEANMLLISAYRDNDEDLTIFDDILKYGAQHKLPAICANPDVEIVNGDNTRYCSGYFAEKYIEFGGEVIYTGKPKQMIFEVTYQFIQENLGNIDKSRILMVGDTVETDIQGGNEFGVDTALVTSGNMRNITKNHPDIQEQLTLITQHAKSKQHLPNHIITLT